ncbi:hypothetical protein ACVNF4_06925 [Streptomyces sp. S6]
MKLPLRAVGLSVLVFASACSTGTHATAPASTPPAAQTPTAPNRLPDPVQSPLPVGSKTLYAGSGRGAGGVTLPASAGKASSVGKVLAGSQCGDGGGVFTAEIPRAHLNELKWKFSAGSSVVWRIVVQPS